MDFDDIRQAIVNGAARRDVARWARHVLHTVATGRTPITPVLHPQGFVCVPVQRTGDRGVCVHVWSDRLRRAPLTTSPIHSHSWNLTSYVLYGAVHNHLVAVTEVGRDATHRLLEIHNNPHGDHLRRTGRLVRCEISSTELCTSGGMYTLPAGVFHTTATEVETATVALGDGAQGRPQYALGEVDTADHHVIRQRCDPAETATLAGIVAEHLYERGPGVSRQAVADPVRPRVHFPGFAGQDVPAHGERGPGTAQEDPCHSGRS